MRSPARILVADDTPANVRMLEARLRHEGYDVVVARDGEEALAVAHETHPDLILLDIMMPKLDGIAVCRRLKGDPKFPFTPIIMVTAMADTKDLVAGFDAGGDDCFRNYVDNTPVALWKWVGKNRFVPPDETADSKVYVKWRKEGASWVVDEIAAPDQ